MKRYVKVHHLPVFHGVSSFQLLIQKETYLEAIIDGDCGLDDADRLAGARMIDVCCEGECERECHLRKSIVISGLGCIPPSQTAPASGPLGSLDFDLGSGIRCMVMGRTGLANAILGAISRMNCLLLEGHDGFIDQHGSSSVRAIPAVMR